eukprot:EG_transcript_1179
MSGLRVPSISCTPASPLVEAASRPPNFRASVGVDRPAEPEAARSSARGPAPRVRHSIWQSEPGAVPPPPTSARDPSSFWTTSDQFLDHARPVSLLPPAWSVARPLLKWLLPPLLLLVAALVGLVFVEDERPSCGVMLLYAGMHVVLMVYFGLVMFLDSWSLLARFVDSIEPLLACCAEELHSHLNPDRRIRCLQLAAYFARSRILPDDDPADGHNSTVYNPLHFVQLEMTTHQHSEDGHLILDMIGNILWCNEALSRYFKYQHGALLSENIRILMPPPYNALHDSLMRKYDRTATAKKIVGCTRPVPVVDRDGRQSKVQLTVEERRDPTDEGSAVFLGKMVWASQPPLHVTLQKHIDQGLSLLEACEAADSPWDDFVLADPRGTILYANPGVCALLGWPQPELHGQNLTVLMDPEVGKTHTAILQKYVRRAEEALVRGECPMSNAVGKNRDLYARCRRGDYFRIWLSVDRVDAPSRRPADCWFVGTFIYIQGRIASTQSQPTSRSPSNAIHTSLGSRQDAYAVPNAGYDGWRRASSSLLSGTDSTGTGTGAHCRAMGRGPRGSSLTGIARKRCTVVAFDFHSAPEWGEEVLASEYERFGGLLSAACSRHNAIVHAPLGNRVLVSLNFTSLNLSQRSAAGLLMQQVLQGFTVVGEPDTAELRAVAACGDVVCASYHRQHVLLGDLVDLCCCMLAVAAEVHAQRGLIDPTLYEELQYAYDCRLINVLSVVPAPHGPPRRVPVYELYAVKEVDDTEWMYQIEAHEKRDPLAAWRSCWSHLVDPVAKGSDSGASEPAYDLALTFLDQHIAEYCDAATPDGPALWLHTVLTQRMSHHRCPHLADQPPPPPPSPDPPGTIHLSLRGRCVVHYSVAEGDGVAEPVPQTPATPQEHPAL